MPIYRRTTVRVYCDGAVHQGLEFTVGENTNAEITAYLRRAGWLMKRDGRVLCPQHKSERTRR